MATYYRVPGGFIAVANEGPRKGPMKGLVLVGRGPKPGGGPETVYEQAFAIAELQKLCSLPVDEVPDAWLEALQYDWPRPIPPMEEIRVEFLPEVFGPSQPQPKRHKNVPPNYWPLILSAALFVAAVLFFHWLKR
jgi:hypothetical protein